MHALFVLCHPEPSSLNAALTRIGAQSLETEGHTIEISNLYGEGFDPLEAGSHYPNRFEPKVFSAQAEQRHAFQSDTLPKAVKREIDRLDRADLVVFQFPIWWHSAPAILKGWMDRVFVSGGLYTSRMRYDRGYFKGKRAICAVTTGAPAETFAKGGRSGTLEQTLWSTQYSLHYMGFAVLPPFAVHGVQGHGFSYASDEVFMQRIEQAKTDWKERLKTINRDSPLAFPGWDDWDEHGAPFSDMNHEPGSS